MAVYIENNVTLVRNLIKENKTYKHVSEILRQSFPEVRRGFSERNVRLFCAKYEIRRLNEYEVDSIVQDCVNEVSLFLYFFVSVCLNRGVPFLFLSLPMYEQISTASLFCRNHLKKLFLPSHLCWSL